MSESREIRHPEGIEVSLSVPKTPSRVCIISTRGVKRIAGRGTAYEFEDVIRSIDRADVIELSPGARFRSREWVVSRLSWRPVLRELGSRLNPGLHSVGLKNDYELLVYICMHPSDLIYLNAVSGWKDRSKVKVCFMMEFYVGWLRKYASHLPLLNAFDHVFTSFARTAEIVTSFTGRPCRFLPLGVDALRFTPFPKPPSRCIDVYSIGKRLESVHQSLVNMANKEGLFYVYDTMPSLSIQPRDHREHRDLFATLVKRSRCFVTYPAKLENEETYEQSEGGSRYYEGAAGGAVLIGRAPKASAFAEQFNWPDAVIEVGGAEGDLQAVLGRLNTNPEYVAALSRRNAVEALRRFDWAYRWRQILEIAGIEPPLGLAIREQQLGELAEMAARARMGVTT